MAHLYLEMKTWDDTSRQECDVACALFWSKKWITGHVLTSDALLHKPFVLEEFGMPKASGGKDQLFQLVYDRLHANIQAGRTSVAGAAMPVYLVDDDISNGTMHVWHHAHFAHYAAYLLVILSFDASQGPTFGQRLC